MALAGDAKERLADWLVSDASRALHGEPLVTALAEQLVAMGIRLARLSTSVLTKHPEVSVHNITWARGEGSLHHERRHAIFDSAEYRSSPAAAIHGGADSIRCKLEGPEAERFELTRALARGGATDYFALSLVAEGGHRTFMSWACDAPGGFTEEEIALFVALRPLIALRFELEASKHTLRSLLDVYLGKNAAAHVLSGKFRRGTGDLVPCAIVFTDMRGFTAYTDRHPAAEVVATLDRFFEVVAGPIHEEGGEILKFIGDAVLAVFRVGEGTPAEACARALAAGVRAIAAVEKLDETSYSPLRLGMALHFGSVMYGNIGAQDRLDFTVIGSAVNEACRIEGLCKSLDRPLLMSAAFVEALGKGGKTPPTESLGRHSLKGVGSQLEVHGLVPVC